VSNNRPALRLLAVLIAGIALPAAAKTYCCTDKTGHRVCGDTLPEQCENVAYREVGEKGVRNVAAPLTAEQRAQRDAEAARKKEQERVVGEQRRKDQALLNTYGNEKDIDILRDRAVADMEMAGKQTQEKYDAALKRKQTLGRELEFYAKKPIPNSLKSQIQENEIEIQAHKKAIEDKNRNIEATRAKFEGDRMRYRELTGTKAPDPARLDTRPR